MNFITEIFKLYKERSDFFIQLLIEHILLSGTAIILITLIGLFIGIYISKSKKVAPIVLAITNFLYTIPSIALLGFLVAISGIGNESAIIALTLYGVLPIIKNTYVGITEVDSQIIESAVAMGSTNKQLLFKIQLPLALPVIISGFRIMVVMTISLAAIASFIGAGGLGVAIWRGITTNFPEMTAAGSILVALLAVVADMIIGIFENSIRKKVLGTEKIGGYK